MSSGLLTHLQRLWIPSGVPAELLHQLKQGPAKHVKNHAYAYRKKIDAELQKAFDVQDEYYPTTGLPVSIVTPASEAWDYTTVANQQKLVPLSAPTP